jgi:hypothetical protein
LNLPTMHLNLNKNLYSKKVFYLHCALPPTTFHKGRGGGRKPNTFTHGTLS